MIIIPSARRMQALTLLRCDTLHSTTLVLTTAGLQPPHEIETIGDYRARHAFYRRDPALQALSAGSPLVAIW